MVRFFTAILTIWCYYALSISSFQYCLGNETVEVKTFSEMEPRSTPIVLDIFELEDKKHLEKNSIYNQVITCFAKPFGNKHGRSTNAHETVHGINNAISNTRKGYRAFYSGCCRCVWLKEPNHLKMEDIIPYIPNTLRGYRYTLYFVKQLKSWNNVCLYPVDEWSAYISGAECAVDDHMNNMLTQKNYDSVSGALEFSIYCTALAKAIKEKQPDYWQNYPQFRNTIQFFLIRSEKVFFEGRTIFPSSGQDSLLNNLQNNKDAKLIRDFLIEEFDGVFIQ
jgi:hypothetical protein